MSRTHIRGRYSAPAYVVGARRCTRASPATCCDFTAASSRMAGIFTRRIDPRSRVPIRQPGTVQREQPTPLRATAWIYPCVTCEAMVLRTATPRAFIGMRSNADGGRPSGHSIAFWTMGSCGSSRSQRVLRQHLAGAYLRDSASAFSHFQRGVNSPWNIQSGVPSQLPSLRAS